MYSLRALTGSGGATASKDAARVLADLADRVPVAVYTAQSGGDGAWHYASPQIEGLLGYSPEEFMTDPGLWARMLHPDDREWVLRADDQARSTTVDRTYAEYRLIARDGRVVWVLDDLAIEPDGKGGSIQYGLLCDITQRKQGELLLAEQAALLEGVARGAGLEETLQALVGAVVRVTEARACTLRLAATGASYLAGDAHALRNPAMEGVPFRHRDGSILGELVLYGTSPASGVRDRDGRLTVDWAGRMAALAVERARQVEGEARSYSLLEATLESTADGILVVDADGSVVGTNQKFRDLWRVPQELAETGSDEELLAFVMDQLEDPEAFAESVRRLYASPLKTSSDELTFRDGRIFERVSQPQLLDGRPVGRVWSFRDVSAFRQLEGELRHQAHTDALTALPNRYRFMERLAELVPDQQPDGPVAAGFALLLIDIDDFKTVNDGLGHLAGDAMLVALAERVSACVREGDMAARLGGDEFAILVRCASGPDEAKQVAQRISAELAVPVDVDRRLLSIRASIGICPTDGGTSARDLVRNADLAMYTAKRDGGACYRLYAPTMHEVAIARLDLRADLDQALEDGSLSVAYQPLVCLRSGMVTGYEALARWQHPTLGTISPAEFIPLAEETGLIARLGQWVLSRVCADLAFWAREIGTVPPPISVNVSPRQLVDAELVGQVTGILAAHGLPPSSICLEVTESGLGDSCGDVASALEEIRAHGIALSLDDFGTGHSSLARLGSYPFNVIKIDRSFVVGITDSTRDRAVVQAVLQLAAAFDLEVVAEGIETPEQRHILAGLGCQVGQGYLFSRPLPFVEAMTMTEPATVLI